MNALLDLICDVVWAWRRSRVIRAEEHARTIGTWAEIAESTEPSDIGSRVRWSARSA
jgi:hypothetical protein